MQANVLIADWYVAPLFPHIWRHGGHNEKGQSTNQLSGRGLVLVQPMDIDISYWTRFLENNVPFDNIPL